MPIELNDNIIKKKSRRKCFITNLSRAETNELEKECLLTLNNNFKCYCKNKKKNHFPEFIKIDKEEYIYMKYCGVNIKTISRENWGIKDIQNLIKKNDSIHIKDAEDQIDCIIQNLKNNNIMNLDNHLHGNNLCILDNTIYLIDFGNAISKNNKKCNFILERDWKNSEIYYKYAKNDLIYILKAHQKPGNYKVDIENVDQQYDYTPFNYRKYIKLRNNNVKKEKI